MSINKPAQKLVMIGGSRKDLSNIQKQLDDGWVIASVVPHQEGYLCVLEQKSSFETGKINLKKILPSVKNNNKHIKISQDA